MNKVRPFRVAFLLLLLAACFVATAAAHMEGNHAGDWTPGQEVKVCVCPPPNNKDMSAAIEGALAAWNNSKDFVAGTRGLKMTWHLSLMDCTHPPADCDVTLDWSPGTAWGATQPGKNPVKVDTEPNGGLDARGVQRVLMHELGHVKGLGHSALSNIMKWNFKGTGASSPTAGQLNGPEAFETPNDDDIALNKKLHGALPAKAAGAATGTPEHLSGDLYRYNYRLDGLAGPGLIDPITRFTLELPSSINSLGDVSGIQMPPGWNFALLSAEPSDVSGKKLDKQEALQKAVLTFFASSPGFGILPGSSGNFAFVTAHPPGVQRAYTNSPGMDSNDFMLAGPSPSVPGASRGGVVALGVLVALFASSGIARRKRLA